MKDLHDKKLLILGGKNILVDMVTRAKVLGVYTVVVDYNPIEISPAKQIADKHYEVSFSDIDRMLEIIHDEKIDGILTGFTDSYLKYYIQLCKAANLPCYGDMDQFEIATNKAAFKKACIAAGVPVIPGTEVRTLEEAREQAEKIGFPIILKPSDNSGSRGVIKVECAEKVEEGFRFALSYSSNGWVILEKYMDCDNIAVSYFAANGQRRLTSTCERRLHISSETGSSITSYTQYPSRYTERYIREVGDAVEKFLNNNKFCNGMIAFQAFVDEKGFYFCEMCFRPSGGHHYILIENQNKVDEMGLLIEFAVTGNCSDSWDIDRETPYFPDTCAMVKLIGTPGHQISSITGIERVQDREEVMDIIPMHSTGDIIGAEGTTAQVLATIWYRCINGKDPIALAHEIADDIVVKDSDGIDLSRISIM